MVINTFSTWFVDKIDRCPKHIDFFIFCHIFKKVLDSRYGFECCFVRSVVVDLVDDFFGCFAKRGLGVKSRALRQSDKLE